MCQLQLLFDKQNDEADANENGDDDDDGIIETTIRQHKDSYNKEKCT